MRITADRILLFLFLLSLIAIAFVSGVISSHYEASFISPLQQGIEAGEALLEKNEGGGELKGNLTLEDAIAANKAEWNPQNAWNGYTLITLSYSSTAYLLDMAGKIVHRWEMPFSKAWPRPEHIRSPVGDKKIYFQKAHVFPNGDLLALYMGFGDTPYGYGLVKMDKDSRLIWKYSAHAHHDFHIDPDTGNILVLTQEFIKRPIAGLENLSYPALADYIVTLSPEGKELSKISIIEAFRDSPYQAFLFQKPENLLPWDATHTNSVAILPHAMAAAFPIFKPGQIMVSLRNINALAVIDPEKRAVVWASNGPWKGQHSAHFLPNGHILLFDNRGFYTHKKTFSRAMEFDPVTLQIGWTYTDTGRPPFYSYNNSRVQRLPNGNTLIAESLSRHVFEITREGKVVWDYRLPPLYKKMMPRMPPYKKPSKEQMKNPRFMVDYQMQLNLASSILSASRYSKEEVAFVNP
jgi:hypothetical protein